MSFLLHGVLEKAEIIPSEPDTDNAVVGKSLDLKIPQKRKEIGRLEIASTIWTWQAASLLLTIGNRLYDLDVASASLLRTIGNHLYDLDVASRVPTKEDW